MRTQEVMNHHESASGTYVSGLKSAGGLVGISGHARSARHPIRDGRGRRPTAVLTGHVDPDHPPPPPGESEVRGRSRHARWSARSAARTYDLARSERSCMIGSPGGSGGPQQGADAVGSDQSCGLDSPLAGAASAAGVARSARLGPRGRPGARRVGWSNPRALRSCSVQPVRTASANARPSVTSASARWVRASATWGTGLGQCSDCGNAVGQHGAGVGLDLVGVHDAHVGSPGGARGSKLCV